MKNSLLSNDFCATVDNDFCGDDGNCVETMGGIIFCECEDSIFASVEFNFEELNVTPCNTNESAQLTLYGFALVFTLVTVFFYTASLRKISQARRLIPYYFCLSFFATLPGLKLFTKRFRFRRLIGHDTLITFVFAMCILFINLSLHMYLLKYVDFQYKALLIKTQKSKGRIKKIDKMLSINTIISFLGAILFIITPKVSNANLKAAEILFRSGFAIALVNAVVVLSAHILLLCTLIKDVQLVSTLGEQQKKIVVNIKGVIRSGVFFHGLNIAFFSSGVAGDKR